MIKDLLILKKLPLFSDLRSPTHQRSSHFPNLDGVRGLAVLIVIASHTQAFFLHRQGGMGVWIFFALSGFLLAYPFVEGKYILSNASVMWRYYARRLLRIIPLYYSVILGLYLFGYFNFSTAVQHVIFSQAEIHFWSIRQELIFYLVLPAILLIVTRFKERAYLVAGGLAIGAFLVQEWLIQLRNLYGLPWSQEPLYIAGFCYGICAAIVIRHLPNLLDGIFGPLLFIFFIVGNYDFTNFILEWFGQTKLTSSLAWVYPNFTALLAALFVLFSARTSSNLFSKFLSSKLLRLFGITGYSVYCFHWFVYGFGHQIGIPYGAYLFLFTAVVTLGISCITYALIERPFMSVLMVSRSNL